MDRYDEMKLSKQNLEYCIEKTKTEMTFGDNIDWYTYLTDALEDVYNKFDYCKYDNNKFPETSKLIDEAEYLKTEVKNKETDESIFNYYELNFEDTFYINNNACIISNKYRFQHLNDENGNIIIYVVALILEGDNKDKLLKINIENISKRRPLRVNSNIKTLYHQTDNTSAEIILKQQKMMRGYAGVMGGGIYFALYPEDTNKKTHRKGVILEVEVCCGKMLKTDKFDKNMNYSKLKKLDYDSIYLTGFKSGPEIVVYNYDQINNIKLHSYK